MNTQDAITEVRRINVAPNDIAVVRLGDHVTPEVQQHVMHAIAEAMPDLLGRVAILPHGYDAGTLDRRLIAALRAWNDAWLDHQECLLVEASKMTEKLLKELP